MREAEMTPSDTVRVLEAAKVAAALLNRKHDRTRVAIIHRAELLTCRLIVGASVYVLKMYPHDVRRERVRWQHELLRSLVASGLEWVPSPVLTFDLPSRGEYAMGHLCAVLEWKHGVHLRSADPQLFARVGKRAAQLHSAAASLGYCAGGGHGGVAIHGDLHVGNFLVHQDELSLIDFDDARCGDFVEDIAAMLTLVKLKRHANAANAFLRQYRETAAATVDVSFTNTASLTAAMATRAESLSSGAGGAVAQELQVFARELMCAARWKLTLDQYFEMDSRMFTK